MDNLKPCPFCGSTDLTFGEREEQPDSRYMHEVSYLRCDDCEASVQTADCPYTGGRRPVKEIIKELTELWNTRVK